MCLSHPAHIRIGFTAITQTIDMQCVIVGICLPLFCDTSMKESLPLSSILSFFLFTKDGNCCIYLIVHWWYNLRCCKLLNTMNWYIFILTILILVLSRSMTTDETKNSNIECVVYKWPNEQLMLNQLNSQSTYKKKGEKALFVRYKIKIQNSV